ncbi:chitin synthase regulatory factor 3 [Parachaetomium inaequale]|uniref:Chitin synthase regulatory factor 3 n=1 Tax=Parachaetomium inaequale TaxID=2588326 RepID=A0AAN6PM92_9PEZI|nr:chitin synthase regulatory factor 3 [Parachaetomium inaequale]
MAHNGQYDGGGGGRQYGGGPGHQRPPPQRHYPPGPGGPQQYNGPPPPQQQQQQQQQQQYDQYQDGYGHGYDEYGNGYDQGITTILGRADLAGAGDRCPAEEGGPCGLRLGMLAGAVPTLPAVAAFLKVLVAEAIPRPAVAVGLARLIGAQTRILVVTNRGPPMGGPGPGNAGGPFPSFPGAQRKSDLDQEQQIVAQMGGMDISGQRSGPRGPNGPPQQRGAMRPPPNGGYGGPGPMGPSRGPPQAYHPQDYPDQRRGPPPGPGYGPQGGGYPEEKFGPPSRSMTMPTRDQMDMRQPGPPVRRDSAPYNGPIGRGPQRPSTAQGMRQPPPRIYPPNNNGPPPQEGYREPSHQPGPDSAYGQDRPPSVDDFYDYYGGNDGYPAQNPPSAATEGPDFDAMSSQHPRNSFDRHMQPGQQPGQPEQAQRGPGRYPEVSRAKSQPDLRNSQTAVFEMAGDIPPLPTQLPGQQPGGFPGGPQPYQGQSGPPPGPGLPPGPAPYRPGMQPPPQAAPNPDTLPSHPTPVRPGHMPGSVVNLSDRPPPVRNYSGATNYSGNTATPPPGGYQQGSPPAQQANNVPAAKPAEAPVTTEELEHLRAVVKNDAGDQATALRLAKRLVEASDALVPNLPDPKARARSRERYLVDAHKILRKLEKANNPDAMFFLADCLGRGLFGSEPDNAHAFSLYQSAAKLGHAAAAYRTAVCCEIGNDEGGGTRKDPLKAIQWYKRAATLGDTPAMYKVGMILIKGLLGQPRNPREAISWLKRAAERATAENPHALHELALLYESAEPNDVILRDEPYAFQLFKQAAELGYKFSQFRLGCAYEYGLLGCPIDPRLSIMWYSRAAMQEEHQSELALSGWYLTGSEGVLQQSDTEAYLWARKAALAGLSKAEYAMGYFTEVGIGVQANMEDAKRWYWRAAAQDFPKARERLEDLKRSGKSGPRARERISRSKIGKQQEGECVVM